MPFFSAERVIVYLKNKSLEFYKEGVEEKAWLEFPKETISDQEIKDQPGLEKLIFEFLAQTGLEKQQALILLSSEVSFQKIVPATDSENEQFEVKKFLEQIPFDTPTIATKLIRTDTNLNIFATNKNLFFGIKNILEKYGWKIMAVVPVAIFEDLSKESLKPEEVIRILNDGKLIKNSDFLNEAKFNEPTKKISPKTLLLSILLVLILGGVLGFLIIKLNLLGKLPFLNTYNKQTQETTSSSAQIKESSPEAKLTSDASLSAKVSPNFDKQQARVQILNGSGVAGQATKLKDRIASLDYKNIQTGNSTLSGQLETTVTYTPLIPTQTREELNNLLNSLLEKVVVNEGSLDNLDILIVSGQSKAPL